MAKQSQPRRKQAASSNARLPPVFYAALIASCSLFALSVVGVIVIIVALSGTSAPAYGVIGVKTEPPGATVFIDGEDVGTSPAYPSVPKDRDFIVNVSLKGYDAPPEKKVSIEDKDLVELDAFILTKTAKTE